MNANLSISVLVAVVITTCGQIVYAGNAIDDIRESLKHYEAMVKRGRSGCGRIKAVMITESRKSKVDSVEVCITTSNDATEVKTGSSIVRSTSKKLVAVYPAAKKILIKSNYSTGPELEGAATLNKMTSVLLGGCKVESDVISGKSRRVVAVISGTKGKPANIQSIVFILDATSNRLVEATMTYRENQPLARATLKYTEVSVDIRSPEFATGRLDVGILDGKGKPERAYAGYEIVTN